VLPGLALSAQNYNNVRTFEFEVGISIGNGRKYDGVKSKNGGQFFLEGRMNVGCTPWDAGLQFSKGAFDRYAAKYGWEQYIMHETLTTFVDYNLRKWKNIALFAGLGVGISSITDEYNYTNRKYQRYDRSSDGNYTVFTPRIGAELFRHLRITMEYRMTYREYAYFGISIGGVLGGGFKK